MAEIATYLRELTLLQWVGVLGFLFYIGSFAAVQFRRMSGNSVAYAWANVIAAFCVLVSLIEAFNLASLLIQLSFITIGLVGITRRLRRRMARADHLRRRTNARV